MDNSIDRRENLSYEEFSEKYLYANRPVIILDALRKWRAVSRWSPEFFKRDFGEVRFSVKDSNNPPQEYTIAQLIDLVNVSSVENPAPYLRNKVVEDIMPSLLPDFDPLPEYCLPNWLPEKYLLGKFQYEFNRGAKMELFIGGKGAGFPRLHYDYLGTHAYLMQIYGEKQLIFFSPDQTEYVYPEPKNCSNSQLRDLEKVDPVRFPLFSKARPLKGVLGPGEMAFIPSQWWHTTRMLSASISTSVNGLNNSNWHRMVSHICDKRQALVAAPIRMYLHFAGSSRARRDESIRAARQN